MSWFCSHEWEWPRRRDGRDLQACAKCAEVRESLVQFKGSSAPAAAPKSALWGLLNRFAKTALCLILLLSQARPQLISPSKPGAGKAGKAYPSALSGARARSFKQAETQASHDPGRVLGRPDRHQGDYDPVRASAVLHGHQVARRVRGAEAAVPELVKVARTIYRKTPWRIVPSVLMAWAALAGTEFWDSRMVDVVEREARG